MYPSNPLNWSKHHHTYFDNVFATAGVTPSDDYPGLSLSGGLRRHRSLSDSHYDVTEEYNEREGYRVMGAMEAIDMVAAREKRLRQDSLVYKTTNQANGSRVTLAQHTPSLSTDAVDATGEVRGQHLSSSQDMLTQHTPSPSQPHNSQETLPQHIPALSLDAADGTNEMRDQHPSDCDFAYRGSGSYALGSHHPLNTQIDGTMSLPVSTSRV
jgi:hypothetical protein